MFYDIYAQLCRERGESPSKVAEQVGLNRSAVVKWKKGTAPSGPTLQRLAEYFGVSADRLLGKEEVRPAGDGELRAAFFRGADPTLTEEEMAALWDDARSYMAYKLAQRAERKKHEQPTSN